MTNPSERAREPELLARELLAAEYEAEKLPKLASALRAGHNGLYDPIALRAIVKALTPTPVEAGSGEIELVARALYARRPIRKQPNRPETWSWEDLCAYFPDEAVEYRTDARAVLSAPVTRDGVVEECAKVADEFPAANRYERETAERIAAAIRQLKDKG